MKMIEIANEVMRAQHAPLRLLPKSREHRVRELGLHPAESAKLKSSASLLRESRM